jgi:hypothetical protein
MVLDKMKNCIVLSGEFRSFRDTVESITSFINTNELDVYCFLWGDNPDEKRYVLNKLKPVNYRFEKYSAHKDIFEQIETRVRSINPKNAPNDKIAGNASMNFARKQAYSLIREHYDNIVYCRYDIDIHQQFIIAEQPDAILTPMEESYNLVSDIFAVIPSEYAPHYFLYDQYERLHSTQFEPKFEEWLRTIKQYGEENIRIHKHERYCPHMMLLRNLFNNNVPLIQQDIPVRLKR